MRKYDKTADKTSQRTSKLSGLNLKSVGTFGAVAGAVAATVAVMRKLEAAYKVQEQAEARLSGVLRATGEAAGFNQRQLKDMASGLQSVTTFGDEAIIGMQSLLLTFKGIQGEAFERTQSLALDLSAAFGQDLKSSALQLGKALEDPATGLTALRRIGVSFTDAQKDMIKALQDAGDAAGAQGVILDVLEGQVGGVAEAMADTATGAADQLGNTWGDLMETFGEGISRGLRPARESLNSLLEKIVEARQEVARGVEIRAGEAIGLSSDELDGVRERLSRLRTQLAELRAYREAIMAGERPTTAPPMTGGLNVQQLEEQIALAQATLDRGGAEARARRNQEIEERMLADTAASREEARILAERQVRYDELITSRRVAMADLQSRQSEIFKLEQQGLMTSAEAENARDAALTSTLGTVREIYDAFNDLAAEDLSDIFTPVASGEQTAIAIRDILAQIAERAKELNDEAEEFDGHFFDFAAREAELQAVNDGVEEYRRNMAAAREEAQRVLKAQRKEAIDLVASLGASFAGGATGGDFSGFARDAVVGLTDALAPGFGQVAGAAVDIFEASWQKMFGATEAELEESRNKVDGMLFEISDSYQSEAELRRQYVDELKDIFGIEQQVLRDQFERGILDVSQFREQGTALNQRAGTEIAAGEARASSEAAADLEAAKSEKIKKINSEIKKRQKEVDKIYDRGWQWFTKKDNKLEAEIDALNARKTKVETAGSLAGVQAAAMGANFMTNGPQLLMVGDNPGGREHVRVDPAPGAGKGGMSGETINIYVNNAYGIEDLEMQLAKARERLSRRGMAQPARQTARVY